MNIGNWLKYEESDNIESKMRVYDKYRATFKARRQGVDEAALSARKRRADTNTYCNSIGKLYCDLVK